MAEKLQYVDQRPGAVVAAPKIALASVLDQLRENGGHVYVGEYRGSAASVKEAFDREAGKKDPGKKYVQLVHSIEVRERGVAKMLLFREKSAVPVDDPESAVRLVPFKRGQCICIVNPWVMERDGQKFFGFNPGAMVCVD